MAQAYEHSTFKLRVPNPYRGLAVAYLVAAAAVVAVDWHKTSDLLVRYAWVTPEQMKANGRQPPLRLTGDAVTALMLAAAGAAVLALVGAAIKKATLLFVPPQCPGGFDRADTLQLAINRRSIAGEYSDRGQAELERLGKYVSRRYLLMTTPVKGIAGRLIETGGRLTTAAVMLVTALAFLRWGGTGVLGLETVAVNNGSLRGRIDAWGDQLNQLPPGGRVAVAVGAAGVALLIVALAWWLIGKVSKGLRLWLLIVATCLAVCLVVPMWTGGAGFRPAMAVTASGPDYQHRLADWVDRLSHLPLPWSLAAVTALAAVAMTATAAVLVPARQPATDVYRHDQHLPGAGPPEGLFDEVKRLAERSPTPGWVRLYAADRRLTPGAIGDTASFTGHLMVEDQPTPVRTRPRWGAILGLAAGLALVAWGLGHDPRRALHNGPVGLVDTTLAQIAAVSLGAALVGRANGLLSLFRFESTVVTATFGGEFTVSEVNIGRGRNDSVESRNRSVRGDLRVRYHAARVTSETLTLAGTRHLVELRDLPDVRDRVATLARGLEVVRDRGVTIARPDFGDVAAGHILEVNQRLAAAGPAAALPPAGVHPGHALPAPVAPRATKVCPMCAEDVAAAAIVCKHCNHRFDGAAAVPRPASDRPA